MLENKKPLLIIPALIVVLLSGAIFISLQNANPTEERGNISGYIVDATNRSPLRGVTVTGEDQDGNQYTSHENTDTTGPDGFFSMELPPNDYTLLFEADGYQAYKTSASYTVEDGKTLEVQETFRLVAVNSAEPAGAPLSQSAEVSPNTEITGEDTGESVMEETGGIASQETALTFSDPALERAIRSELKLEKDQVLTLNDALQVKTLNLAGGGKEEADKIKDITGLSYFTNLEELSLQTNRVSNIEVLAGLKKLKKLQLENNYISDVTPLSGLDSLRKLEIASNNISDISPLYSLKNLELLDVIDNNIASIKGIGSMLKLHTLRLGRNMITDISPLADLKDLTHLGFGHNSVEDIGVLYNLPMLHVLTFNGNRVKDIGPVAYMPELRWLEVAGNPIEDESILDNLPESVKHLER